VTHTAEELATEAIKGQAKAAGHPMPDYVAKLLARAAVRATARGTTKAGLPLPEERHGVRLRGRQLEIIRLYAQGRTTAEIATELGVEPSTVDHHRMTAIQAIGARRLPDAVARAFALGFLSPADLAVPA
jgi:DNA-binding NarL/FixJ family response regulator